MRNHDQKIKDMCESVLPSTSRKNAREKRRIAHGADRARERAALRAAATGGDHERQLDDSDGRRRAAIHEMVSDRRNADKVAPLVRWARATVERDPGLRDGTPEDVIAHFSALLPDNLIGRHAVQHIQLDLGLESEAWRVSWERRMAREREAAAKERTRYRDVVIALVRAGQHGDINRVAKRLRRAQIALCERDGKPVDEARLVPLLAGPHAVDGFVTATENNTQVRSAILGIA